MSLGSEHAITTYCFKMEGRQFRRQRTKDLSSARRNELNVLTAREKLRSGQTLIHVARPDEIAGRIENSENSDWLKRYRLRH